MKKIIYIVLVATLFMGFKTKALEYLNTDIESSYATMYNVTDNMIMYDKSGNERIKIASLTKIMTAIIAIENINDFDEKVVITENDYQNVYSENLAVAGFKVGDTVSYSDLLYGLLFKSGADAAYALANNISGSEAKFVELMNKKSNELGLKNTKFTNTVGYDDDNYSTTYDVAIIFSYALQNEMFKHIISEESYMTTNGIHLTNVIDTLIEKNQITSTYSDYVLGGKTGYTNEAKNCLASYAEYDGTTYIVVTAQAMGHNHILDNLKQYETAFTNFSRKKIVNVDDYLISLTSKQDEVKVYAKEEVDVLLPNEVSKDSVKVEYKGITKIDNNIKKNSLLGKVNLEYDGEVIKTIDIIYDKKIQKSFNYVPIKNHKGGNGISIFGILFSIFGIIIILVGFIFISMYIDVKKHKRRWKF